MILFVAILTLALASPSFGLSNCGTKAQGCYNSRKDNITIMVNGLDLVGVCMVYKEALDCMDALQSDTDCSNEPNLSSELTALKSWAASEVRGNCGADGSVSTCALDVKKCVEEGELIKKIANNSAVECLEARKFSTCLDDTVANKECSSQFLKMLLEAESTVEKLTDPVCYASSKLNGCVSKLNACVNGLSDLDRETDADKWCQAAAKFVECASNLPCDNKLGQYVIATAREGFNTKEHTAHCPTVGSCTDRLGICANNEISLSRANQTLEEFCKNVNAGLSCFEFVRTDPVCSEEKMEIGKLEESLKTVLKQTCEDSASVTQLSLLLVVVSSLVSWWNFV